MQIHSLRVRAALVFWITFFVVISIGALGFYRLTAFSRESSEIHDRWLQNTRYLGDLANYTSDFRALEGELLLAPTPSDVVSLELEIAPLDASVRSALQNYERLAHDPWENEHYRRFNERWSAYRSLTSSLFASAAGTRAEAITTFMDGSRRAFADASEILGQLTERNNQLAQEAGIRANAAVQEARFFVGMTIAVSGAMVLLILAYVTKSVTTPLIDIARKMHRLSHGDMDIAFNNIHRADELGEMARAVVVFRKNAIDLRASQLGLAHQASMLEERLAHEQKLSQQQRNFISMASHEFRTPMTVVDGHAQRLINAGGLPRNDAVIERARKIRIAVKRMKVMIDNLLETSKLMDADPTLYFHPLEFDVRALLHDVCALQREITPKAMLIEDIPNGKFNLFGDKKLLFLAFSNLVSNAVKYSPEGGLIRLKAAFQDGHLIVIVTDQGIGIPPDDAGRIFDRYFRGSNVSGIIGTGIGLYFVKMVFDLHGGEIAADGAVGRGASFTARMPMAPAAQLFSLAQDEADAAPQSLTA